MKTQALRKLIREEDKKVIAESHDDQTNYMFFQNLHTIKRMIEKMMEMNSEQVDQLLSNGHGWAVDHIATSTDDVSEVATWLCNELGEEMPNHMMKEEEMSAGLKAWRNKQKKGAIMKPSTFDKIKAGAKKAGSDNPEAVAGAAYWTTAKSKYNKSNK